MIQVFALTIHISSCLLKGLLRNLQVSMNIFALLRFFRELFAQRIKLFLLFHYILFVNSNFRSLSLQIDTKLLEFTLTNADIILMSQFTLLEHTSLLLDLSMKYIELLAAFVELSLNRGKILSLGAQIGRLFLHLLTPLLVYTFILASLLIKSLHLLLVTLFFASIFVQFPGQILLFRPNQFTLTLLILFTQLELLQSFLEVVSLLLKFAQSIVQFFALNVVFSTICFKLLNAHFNFTLTCSTFNLFDL
mmetsp:Transcript_10603/g.39514  ORF Transcript_10603/g.39514 Transcript_10603/m.39514 type:complete len:249 (+) Transcript_10603:1784-2530(+)